MSQPLAHPAPAAHWHDLHAAMLDLVLAGGELERTRELTGLDPLRHAAREQLGIGLKAHALLRCATPGKETPA